MNGPSRPVRSSCSVSTDHDVDAVGDHTTGRVGASLLQGLAASSGTASGGSHPQVTGGGRHLQRGEVLVAPMTNPDWVPTIRRAAALVTDGGGMTCHAAIVAVSSACRASSVPARRRRLCATASWSRSTALRGSSTRRGVAGTAAATPAVTVATPTAEMTAPLATRIYVNLAMPDHAEEVAAMPVDGVGLLRAEFMLTGAPVAYIPANCYNVAEAASSSTGCRHHSCVSPGRSILGRLCTARSTSAPTSSVTSRVAAFEPVEENPMIGYRGCYRYVLSQSSSPWSWSCWPEFATRPRTYLIPFVRTKWELKPASKPSMQEPARPPTGSAPVGDGGGPVGRLPHPGIRGHGRRRCINRLQRRPVDARRRP